MKEQPKLDRSLRDLLAIDRTRLANRRTLLAFVMTTLHIIALGITFDKVEEFAGMRWLSIPLFVMAGLSLVLGLMSYFKVKKDVEQAYNLPSE